MARVKKEATYAPLSRGRFRFNQSSGKAVILKKAAVRAHRNSQLHGKAPRAPRKKSYLDIKIVNSTRYCPYCEKYYPSYIILNPGRNYCKKCGGIFIVP